MSAEATNPAMPGPVTPGAQRRRGRPRLDLRRLGRAALMGGATRDRLPDAIGHVAEAHRAHYPDADLEPLRRAWVLAESSHRGQMRKSGEPYITHPLAVTLILAQLGAEITTLTASLLHDTVEDTDVTLDQVRTEFGDDVCYLVDGVTKLEKVDYGAAAEPETFRKMLVATGNDVRVMSIKLADRLHNMRTLGVMRPEKQARIAKVTRDVLIPLAERLGVQALKTELEDLVFAILHPEEYERVKSLIAADAEREGDPLEETADDVRGVLREAGISAEVLIRPRHFVSVHRVHRKRGELRAADFGRLLVLVNEDADCYGVLGELHTCFTPVVSEFKDFIAVPKFNLYQSLHTAVARPDGEVAEVLIRTHQMHKVAEAGVVALRNPYAPPSEEQSDSVSGDAVDDGERADPTRPGWLSRLLDWQQAAPDPDTFWSTLREDLAQDREIAVFRPDGGTLGLAGGRDVCGRRLRPVRRGRPRLYRRARQRPPGDAQHGPAGRRHGATAHGAGRGVRALTRVAGPRPHPRRADRHPALAHQPPRAHLSGRSAGAADAHAPAAARRLPRPAAANAVVDREGASVRLAGCCTPVPPDEVTAFAVRGGVVTVHRVECPAVARMKEVGRAEVGVRWGDSAGCRVTLTAESFGRAHLLADLTEAIALEGVEIMSATVEPPSQQRVRHTYTLQLPDAAGLPGLMRAMRAVPGVYDVSRAQHPAAATS